MVAACRKAGAWAPVLDPDTGELISDAKVTEVTFTAFAPTNHPITARLLVRRVRDRAKTTGSPTAAV